MLRTQAAVDIATIYSKISLRRREKRLFKENDGPEALAMPKTTYPTP